MFFLSAQRKIGTNFLEVVDVVLHNLSLSPELEQAIEMKMVQEQDASKAKFTQLKAQFEADTAIIRAKGEAEAIDVRGQALRTNPDFIKLQIVQSWNGKSPLVVGADGGANMLLNIDELTNTLRRQRARSVRPRPAPRLLEIDEPARASASADRRARRRHRRAVSPVS